MQDRLIQEKIIIANLKCSGCANTIRTKLSALEGMDAVVVEPESDSVEVTYTEPLDREKICSTLKGLGYPEATEENGLLLQIKSYASCMVGRMQKD